MHSKIRSEKKRNDAILEINENTFEVRKVAKLNKIAEVIKLKLQVAEENKQLKEGIYKVFLKKEK